MSLWICINLRNGSGAPKKPEIWKNPEESHPWYYTAEE
jgi:hypothetical protein